MAESVASTAERHYRRFLDECEHVARPFGQGSFGARAEAFARFFGTPTFLIIQTVIVAAWILINATQVVTSTSTRSSCSTSASASRPRMRHR